MWLFCVGNGERKKLQCIWGHAEAKEEFAADEMCASLKAAMGMPATDGDNWPWNTFFNRVYDGSECD